MLCESTMLVKCGSVECKVLKGARRRQAAAASEQVRSTESAALSNVQSHVACSSQLY